MANWVMLRPVLVSGSSYQNIYVDLDKAWRAESYADTDYWRIAVYFEGDETAHVLDGYFSNSANANAGVAAIMRGSKLVDFGPNVSEG